MTTDTQIQSLIALRYVQSHLEDSEAIREAIQELEGILQIPKKIMKTKTNQEIVERFMKVKRFVTPETFLKEALELKDKQARQEKIELVEGAPIEPEIFVHFEKDGIMKGVISSKSLEEWKTEKLTQLKNES